MRDGPDGVCRDRRCCIFATATMNSFQTRCRSSEVVLLFVATFALFQPDFFMKYVAIPTRMPRRRTSMPWQRRSARTTGSS